MKHFALAGNPNSGKTTLFNSLTGSTAYVGNWPGVTVDKREGIYKKGVEPISIVDLPGIYSLSPYTNEEVVSRNFLLDEKPDCIINVIDATNLERNLYLTTQLLEIDVPLIIALNMMDSLHKSNRDINIKKMEEILHIKVVPVSALKEENLDSLMKEAYEVSKTPRKSSTVLNESDLNDLIVSLQNQLEENKVPNALFHAIKIVEGDEIEIKHEGKLYSQVLKVKEKYSDKIFKGDFEAVIADRRYQYISTHLQCVRIGEIDNQEELTPSDRIDKVMTNKWAGIPIFLFILLVIFHLTFSSNLLFLGGLFTDVAPSFEGTAFEGLFWTSSGINSIGVFLQNLLAILTDSITSLASSGLESINSPLWVQGFLVDGVLTGLFAILGFLPQILLLFLFFSILEDSGYMARIAFILDRIMRKFGLSGRALMPLIMGFGCSVPAMINTRTLADENERTATIRVIPFFSCGAKLPILTAIAGGIATEFNFNYPDLITYGMYILGMSVAVISVLLMRNTTLKGETPSFIMELPSYHLPQFKALMIHLWDKVKHFVKKAFTIILASTIVIWFISHFSWNWTYLENEQINTSILANIGQLLQPLFIPLGFGSQIGEFGWVFVAAVFMGLVAKENVITIMGVLASCIVSGFVSDEALEGVDSVIQLINVTSITPAGLIAFIAFNMLTIPCFAACATAKSELPKGKFKTTVLFWIATSYIVSSCIYLIGTWYWTVFIIVPIIGLALYLVPRFNKKKQGLVKGV